LNKFYKLNTQIKLARVSINFTINLKSREVTIMSDAYLNIIDYVVYTYKYYWTPDIKQKWLFPVVAIQNYSL
jgi:hypothetical protein